MPRWTRAGIFCSMLAAVFTAPGEVAAQVPVTVLHSFDALTAPRAPYSPLIQGSDGNFYGTTASGGTDGAGTVYRMSPAGTVTVLHSFNRSTEGSTPFAGLLQAADGNFYGSVTIGPNYSDGGRLFRMTAQGTVTVIAPFAASALVEGPDGALYGVGRPSPSYAGSVFKWQAGTYTTLHDFASFPSSPEGYGPSTLMLGADGKFYGTTAYGGAGGGAIFRVSSNGAFETLHSFTGGTEGAAPNGPLVQTPDGAIFGTSGGGGAGNAGTVFRLGPDLTFSVIHYFVFSAGSPGGLIAGGDGAFYGTTGYRGMLYRITAAGEFTPISTDPGLFTGWASQPVLGQDGHFYLTNASTGSAGAGSIGRVTAGGSATVLYEFSGSSEGTNPIAPLLQAPNGNFYGTTPRGGPAGRGAVFVVSPTGQFTTLHTFSGPDGATPSGALIRTPDGRFYGMTSDGGSFDRGTVYRMEPSGEVTVLHSFAGGEDGSHPAGALLKAADGDLYGTTSNGGSSDRGTAFRITLAGSLTILHAFDGINDGSYPASGLFQGTDGNFYGVTLSSSDSYYGTAYRMTAAGTVTVLHRLYRHDGDYSYVGVNPIMQANDGNLYGTTQGRKGVRGTFFRIDPAGNVTILREFASDREFASNGLIQASDGNLYGIIGGAIARLTLSGELTTIRTLDYLTEGTQPNALLQAADGNFYTTTWDGGRLWGGTVLRITVAPSPPGVTVATRRDGTIRLTWPQGAPGTSYRVKRGGTSGSETLLASGITTNTFSDPTAVRGRRYYYVVTAINAFGESVAAYEVAMTAGQAVAGDFDGDSAADITVFRPGSGEWFVLGSETTYSTPRMLQWGLPGDLPAPGDFDGDGTADAAIYRPLTGMWWVLKSSSDFTQSFSIQWGLPGDAPVPADYDGDGRTDVAVYRPSTGEWYIRWSGTDYATASTYQWGLPGDFPVPGDYDGDGLTDLAVHRPSNGVWYVRSSSSHYTAMSSYQWGLPGDVAVPGDYDGDGRTDFAIYRPSTGEWYVRQSSTNYTTYAIRQWGLPGDTPVPADYDGDGITDFAVFRPGGSVWYVMHSVTFAWESHQWGFAGDVPINRR